MKKYLSDIENLIQLAALLLPQVVFTQSWVVTNVNYDAFDYYRDAVIDDDGNLWISHDRKIFSDTTFTKKEAALTKISPFGEIMFDTIINHPIVRGVYNGDQVLYNKDTIFYFAEAFIYDEYFNVSKTSFIELIAFDNKGRVLYQQRDTLSEHLDFWEFTPDPFIQNGDIVLLDGIRFSDSDDVRAIDKITYETTTGQRKSSKRIWFSDGTPPLNPVGFHKLSDDTYYLYLDYMNVSPSNPPNNLDTCDIEYVSRITLKETPDSAVVTHSYVNYNYKGGEWPSKVMHLDDESTLYVGQADTLVCWISVNTPGKWISIVDATGKTDWTYYKIDENFYRTIYTSGLIPESNPEVVLAVGVQDPAFPKPIFNVYDRETGELIHEHFYDDLDLYIRDILPVPGEDAYYIIGDLFYFHLPLFFGIFKQNITVLKVDQEGNILQTTAVPNISSESEKFKLFPNPGQDAFRIECQDCTQSRYNLQVYNSTGKLVIQQDEYTLYESITTNDLPPGQYVIKLVSKSNKVGVLQWLKFD